MRPPRDNRGPDAQPAWPMTKTNWPRLQAFSERCQVGLERKLERIAFWGPVPRTGLPRRVMAAGDEPEDKQEQSAGASAYLNTKQRGSGLDLKARLRRMGCGRAGGGWAWGMSDEVLGRPVTASQRCRPLSSRQDVCGGLASRRPPRDLWLPGGSGEGLRPGPRWERV